jgi:hypothetical protein
MESPYVETTARLLRRACPSDPRPHDMERAGSETIPIFLRPGPQLCAQAQPDDGVVPAGPPLDP